MSDQHGLETVVARLRILGHPDPVATGAAAGLLDAAKL
jgi:hypothetical protein